MTTTMMPYTADDEGGRQLLERELIGLARASGLRRRATVTGVALVYAKELLGHGDWLPWLEENFNGSQPTASRYMKMAEANYSPMTNLDPPKHVERYMRMAVANTAAVRNLEPQRDPTADVGG